MNPKLLIQDKVLVKEEPAKSSDLTSLYEGKAPKEHTKEDEFYEEDGNDREVAAIMDNHQALSRMELKLYQNKINVLKKPKVEKLINVVDETESYATICKDFLEHKKYLAANKSNEKYLDLLSGGLVNPLHISCFTRIIDNKFKKNSYLKKPTSYNIEDQSDLFSYEERKLAIGELFDVLDDECELQKYDDIASYNIKDSSEIFSDQHLESFLGSSLLDALDSDIC